MKPILLLLRLILFLTILTGFNLHAQTTLNLPFSESFSDGGLPEGWSQQSMTGETYWSISPSNHSGGLANELKCSGIYGYNYSRIILPPINTQGILHLNLRFKTSISNAFYEDYFHVQTSSDGTNWTNEVWNFGGELQLASMDVNTMLSHNLGGITYVAFQCEGFDLLFSEWDIDDIEIENLTEEPACAQYLTPGQFSQHVPVIPASTFSWEPTYGASGYLFYLGTDNPPTNLMDGTDLKFKTAVQISGLPEATNFFWQVIPYGPLGSPTCPIQQFSTAPFATIPFSCQFDTPEIFETWTVDQTPGMAEINYSNTSNAGGEPGELGVTAAQGNGILRIISPPLLTQNVTNPVLTFKYRLSESGSAFISKIQVSNDGHNWTDESWSIFSGASTQMPSEVNLPLLNVFPDKTYIAIVLEGNLMGLTNMFFDDISVNGTPQPPGCAVIVTPGPNETQVSLNKKLEWTGINATGYRLFLGTNNPPTNIINGMDIGNFNEYNLTHLIPAQTYFWKVVPYNNAGEANGCQSNHFTTLSSVALPYTNSFESTQLPQGWLAEGENNLFQISFSNYSGGDANEISFSSNSSLQGYSRWITPPLNTAGMSKLLLKFRNLLTTNAEGATIKVQSSSNGIDWLDEGWTKLSGTNQTWGPEFVNLPIEHPGSVFTFLSFLVEGQLNAVTWYLDNISIEDYPSAIPCAHLNYPENGATGTSISPLLQWDWVPSANNYLISLGTNPQGNSLINRMNIGNTNHYQVNGLNQGTEYWWKIESYNTTGDTSICSLQNFVTFGDSLENLPFTEQFSQSFPDRWTTFPENSAHWMISHTHLAGGTDNEIMATYENTHQIKTTRIISPPINAAGKASLNVEFRHFFIGNGNNIRVKIQSSNDRINWTDESWQLEGYEGNYGPELVSTTVTHNLGIPTYIAWVLEGDQYNFNYWYIDDIHIEVKAEHDISMVSVSDNHFHNASDSLRPWVTLINNGTSVESFMVTLKIPGTTYVSQREITALKCDSVIMVHFDPVRLNPGQYSLVAYSELPSDQQHSNDTLRNTSIHVLFSHWTQEDNVIVPGNMGSGAVYHPDSLHSYLMVSGGDANFNQSLQCYNFHTGDWQIIDTMPETRRNHASAILGNDLYIIGGVTSSFDLTPTPVVWRYNIPSHSWDTVQSLPVGLRSCKATTCDDSLIYLASGINAGWETRPDIFVFNIITGKWRAATSLPEGLAAGAFCQNAGKLFYAGGSNSGGLSDKVYIGTIHSDNHAVISWTQQTYPSGTFFRFDAAKWGDSAIIMTGGGSRNDFIPDNPNPCWIYHLGQGNWTAMPDLSVPVLGAAIGSASVGENAHGDKIWKFAVAGGYDGTQNYQGTQTITDTLASGAIEYSTIHGNLLYDNTLGNGITNITIRMKSGNTLVDSVITGAGGAFTFSQVPPGTYTLEVLCQKPWAGGNATDALLIMKHFVNMTQLSGLKLVAADADNSGFINTIDALTVMKRFVGMISSFNGGNWKFERPVVTVISGENPTIVIKGLCTGDVDASYIVPQ